MPTELPVSTTLHRLDFVRVRPSGQYGIVERVGDDAEIEDDHFFTNAFFKTEKPPEGIPEAEEVAWVPESDVAVSRWHRVPPGYALVYLLEAQSRHVYPVTELRLENRKFRTGDFVMHPWGKQLGVVKGLRQTVAVVPCLTAGRGAAQSASRADSRRCPSRNGNAVIFSPLPPNARVVDSCRLQTYPASNPNHLYIKEGTWLVRSESECLYFRVALERPGVDTPAVCVLNSGERLLRLKPLLSGKDTPYTIGTFYPGQKIEAAEAVWRSATWIEGAYPAGVLQGTVLSVTVSDITGNVIAAKKERKEGLLLDMSTDELAPACPTNPYLEWGPGDIGILPDEESEEYVLSRDGEERVGARDEAPAGGLLAQARRRLRQRMSIYGKRGAKAPKGTPVRIAAAKTLMDIQWQDGTMSYGVHSAQLDLIPEPEQYDFFPGFRVALGADEEEIDSLVPDPVRERNQMMPANISSAPLKHGLVLKVNNEQRSAVVKWDGEQTEEVLPLYVLEESLPIRIRDIVIRTDREHHAQWVGEVLDIGEKLKVQWSDGRTDLVSHDSIIRVASLNDEHYDDVTSDEEEETSSEEEDEERLGSFFQAWRRLKQARDLASTGTSQNWTNEAGWTIPADGAWPPYGELIYSNSELMLAEHSGSVPEVSEITLEEAAEAEAESHDESRAPDRDPPAPEQEPPAPEREAPASEDTEIENESRPGDDSSKEASGSTATSKDDAGSSKSAEEFFEPPFKLVDDLHSFAFPQSGKPMTGVAKRIQTEWRSLARHLPPGIFVHGCESRLDLLRAAVVGPADTPYEDILFFFDIFLPSDYPAVPPGVFFHSHNRALNPNLYPSGFVCLSILGTWKGKDVESWDPATSDVRRVLLSLQALVFTKEPYFNEPENEREAGVAGVRWKARQYNETVTLLALRHMITTLRPGGAPEDFAEFATKYYARKARAITERCRKLVAADRRQKEPAPPPPPTGAADPPEGSLRHGGAAAPTEPGEDRAETDPSSGFRQSLRMMMPKLEATLERCRAQAGEGNSGSDSSSG